MTDPCEGQLHCDHEKTTQDVHVDCDREDCDGTHTEIVCSKCGRHFRWES